jgi:hypothetical protein
VGAAPFPLPDDVVAFGDEVGGAPELEVGERRPEVLGEFPDLVSTAQRSVERVFEADVRRGDLIDHGWVEVLSPELGEPAADDGLVLVC